MQSAIIQESHGPTPLSTFESKRKQAFLPQLTDIINPLCITGRILIDRSLMDSTSKHEGFYGLFCSACGRLEAGGSTSDLTRDSGQELNNRPLVGILSQVRGR